MAKYYRRRARSAPSRRKFSRRPAGRRFKSKARKTYMRKKVTVKMLRNVVPRPELKYFANENGANAITTANFLTEAFWLNAFLIPQGVGLGARVGNSVWLKMIEVHVESIGRNNPASVQDVETSAGVAGHGNTIGNTNLDQAIRLVIVDSVMDAGSGLPADVLELMGSSQNNAYGGGSQYYELLDKLQLHAQKRMIRMDKKIMHHKGVLEYPFPAGPSADQNGFFGFKPQLTEKMHKFVIKFPGQGYKLQYDSNTTVVPARMPVAYVCAKNSLALNNPFLRWNTVRLWFTDP